MDYETETLLAHSLRGGGFDASEDGTGRGTPIIAFDTTQITSKTNRCQPQNGDPCHPIPAHGHAPAIAFSSKGHGADAGETAPTLRAGGHTNSHANAGGTPAVAFAGKFAGQSASNVSPALDGGGGGGTGAMMSVSLGSSVRRLTPRECERLQGFHDDYTLIPYRGKDAADGPRYKALGNSMAVPVMRWIGMRINQVEAIHG